jgi:hypothetical protein
VAVRSFPSAAEERAYRLGVQDGNEGATRVLIGGKYPIRVKVDPLLPPDEIWLVVRTEEDIHAPRGVILGLIEQPRRR